MISIKNILTAIVIVAIFSLHPSLNKGPLSQLHYFVYGNEVNFSFNDIDPQQISIKWSCENYQSNCKELVIYENGEMINEIPFEKGVQQIAIYYNQRLIGNLKQNKARENESHQYTFSVSSDDENINFKGEITGPSPSTFSQTITKKDIILAKV